MAPVSPSPKLLVINREPDESEQHYTLKKAFLSFLSINPFLGHKEVTDIDYDVTALNLPVGVAGGRLRLQPDVTIKFSSGETLIVEVETDPWNIFDKLLKLRVFYLLGQKLPDFAFFTCEQSLFDTCSALGVLLNDLRSLLSKNVAVRVYVRSGHGEFTPR